MNFILFLFYRLDYTTLGKNGQNGYFQFDFTDREWKMRKREAKFHLPLMQKNLKEDISQWAGSREI